MNNFIRKDRANQRAVNIIFGSRFLYYLTIVLLSLIITAPLFIIFYRYFPDMIIDAGVIIRVDMILCFLLIFTLIFSILRFFSKKFIIGVFSSFIIVLAVLQLFDIYSFGQIKQSYYDLINYVEVTPVKLPFLKESKMTIRNAAAIKKAVDYKNPELRDFAVKASVRYFNKPGYYSKYGNIIRYFSVFKVINNWDYVADPRGLDYFAKASESAKLLAGDCDDHAILMAACIKAIGGKVRLVHTVKHLYPEVAVGKTKDLNTIYFLVKRLLFYKESMGHKLYYRIDSEDNVWLNFDYTGKYPGAKYMNDKILGILNI